jgi:hypothetical protein
MDSLARALLAGDRILKVSHKTHDNEHYILAVLQRMSGEEKNLRFTAVESSIYDPNNERSYQDAIDVLFARLLPLLRDDLFPPKPISAVADAAAENQTQTPKY